MKKQIATIATVQKTPKRVLRTLVSVLKKLDAAQDFLAGDQEWVTPDGSLDKADTLVWEVRGQLRRLIGQPDQQTGQPEPQATQR